MRTSEVLALEEEQYSRAATKASAKTNISRASRFVSVWKHKRRIAGEMGSFPDNYFSHSVAEFFPRRICG